MKTPLPTSSLAKRYAGRGTETDDLIRVARTALVLAADSDDAVSSPAA